MQDTFIGGFGEQEKDSVYSIKDFEIRKLIFKDFDFFVLDESRLRFPFQIIANLFYGMDYEFDTINEQFIVKMKDEQNFERNFKIKYLNGKLYPQIDGILFQDTDIELQSFYIF